MKLATVLVLSGVLCAGGIAAGVQLKVAATGETNAAIEEPQARIIREFSELAGSEANARSLVTGLRQGSEITLTVPANGGQPGMATRFTPPTRSLDDHDVLISLALARSQFAQLGIDRPTPSQIKAVLVGGGVATRVSGQATTPFLFPGVLQLRASGLGWAKIADSMGILLKPTLNGNAHPAALTPAPISSAWITTTVAVTPRNAAVVRQPAPALRPAGGGPEPEMRRSGASIVTAAQGVAKARYVTMPVREDVNSMVGVQGAVVEAPGAADELIRPEEGPRAD